MASAYVVEKNAIRTTPTFQLQGILTQYNVRHTARRGKSPRNSENRQPQWGGEFWR